MIRVALAGYISQYLHITSDKKKLSGFVCKCWVNIPNEIAIFHRDNDHENHWVFRGLAYCQTISHGASVANSALRILPSFPSMVP